ncbi:MAG: hypothetical protein GY841_15895, partial [FCB group bacterium]|nr:hypothetical protein [FCB group bacterium]
MSFDLGAHNRENGTEYRNFTELIGALYYASPNLKLIGQYTGIPHSTLCVMMKKRGIVLPSRLDLNAQKEGFFNFGHAVQTLYGAMPSTDLADLLKCSQMSVLNAAKKMELKINRRG